MGNRDDKETFSQLISYLNSIAEIPEDELELVGRFVRVVPLKKGELVI